MPQGMLFTCAPAHRPDFHEFAKNNKLQPSAAAAHHKKSSSKSGPHPVRSVFACLLPTCLLPPRSVASCLCAFCSTKLDSKAVAALSVAVCQHVDPTIACETFWQHQCTQMTTTTTTAAHLKQCRMCNVVVVAVIYVIFQNFCLVCVSALQTHSRISKEQQKTAALASASASVYTGWSGLVSYSSSLATLCSCSLLSFATFYAVRSCLLQCLRCGRVFSESLLLLPPTSAASASCQVILLFLL